MSDIAKNLSVADAEEKANYEKLANVIDLYSGKEGCLIQVLHAAQEIFGYLPFEVQKYVADNMGFSVSYVSSVSSFYSFFSTTPRTKHDVRVCLGTACYVRGGKLLIEKLQELLGIGVGEATADNLFSIHVTRCVGACGLAPVVVIDDEVYKQVKPGDLAGILDQYRGE
ncbi:MAG: NAD(P)H-dependent oxidoreductase subunit E [Clostridia bacterium]|nr:NAD(P)H-dependent oxidoreductase subunit E [Clostridia bacterium]